MSTQTRIVVALSGGVDSSVAAALLKEQGHDVIGIMLRLWSEPGSESHNRCCTPDAMAQARRVAAQLEIPFYAMDVQDAFHHEVVQYFIDGYTKGNTPNPCLACNRQIRWTLLLERALALGAQYMATGHYARTHTDDGGQVQLLKARDRAKDQSYVLHVLNQERLQHACFPIGEYPKSEVREIARRFNLPIAERPDSQDLCFLGNGDYHSFLLRNAPDVLQPGPILNRAGVPLGEHQGLAFYTIGQRKGLGLAPSNPLYVLEKDVAHNALIVGYKHELGCKSLTATQMNWIDGAAPSTPFRAEIKIRYKAREAWAVVTPKNESSVEIQFDEPVLDITPGQAAVIYNGDICLGGGIIQTAG